ncbi:hypothetical protein BABINDRAFT_54974 [Babjeviella inositovora NRRL Y-12698]|uniref:Protein arginine methyltransferase NDUFAF7 n=1 Tax=Babjeviella inositovora NRRL Y-12698 TaxID=984486 RepID=A0A1E3QHP6_9ASCO|nr:uncharacterized protein BABINDRAFT_54974 [Babjeviella inositovora NRRL Y-12698]ODQ77225.1 hypothetical protein BABINDRAFT_54974 [Babjeviella inositovora NRRL Y-12698]
MHLKDSKFFKYFATYVSRDPLNDRSVNDTFESFPTVDSAKLARFSKRPKNVKMLTSDFIEDSLYNPHYGYFNKEVEIFQTEKPFDYNNIRDNDEFINQWYKEYKKYEPPVATEKTDSGVMDVAQKSKQQSVQLWHTPTELFLPFYGEALANYILMNYKLNQYPYNDLIIYEMGGGNGTLMANILSYIRQHQPDIYARTKYKIIEISSKLASKQMKSAISLKLAENNLDASKVQIINKSIFEWDTKVTDPCYFIALEVFDNFSHDVVRYDNLTQQPYQGYVSVDDNGDFKEFYSPELTPYTKSFLNLRERTKFASNGDNQDLSLMERAKKVWKPQMPLDEPLYWRQMKNQWWPFRYGLSQAEYVPTRLVEFFHILKYKFPNHSLLTSDFHYLPDALPGYTAPVVQTMLGSKMVTTDTYMVYQGFFDIMFPTNFELACELYREITGKTAALASHRAFLEQWADVDHTKTKKGENPMLNFYQNASFMYS